MTGDLRERLDDLLTGVPPYVRADAGLAVRTGARRRVRRRLAAGAVVALTTLGGVGLAAHRATEPRPVDGSGSSRPAASAHPVRVDAPLLRTGSLPNRAGPIAGLVRRDVGWVAIGQAGQVWRIPGATDGHLASISPDGTRIAYVGRAHGQSELSLLDLVVGGAFAPDIGGSGPRHPWLLRGDGQTFWSPDSSRLLVPVRPGSRDAGGPVAALVVTPGRASTRVTAVPGRHVEPVGWLSPTRLGWLRWTSDAEHPDVVTTDVRGHVLASTRAPGRISANQFVSATAMPDAAASHELSVTTAARQILISNPGRRGDSALLGSRPLTARRLVNCPVSWGYWAYLPVVGPDFHVLKTGVRSYEVQLDPGLLPWDCSVWSTDALRGSARHGLGGVLFGDRADWWSWHWRQVATGILAGLVVVATTALVGVRRRRKRA